MTEKHTSSQKKARELAQYLRGERPDYAYLKNVFQHLRTELEINVPKASKKQATLRPHRRRTEAILRGGLAVEKLSRHDDRQNADVYRHSGQRVDQHSTDGHRF